MSTVSGTLHTGVNLFARGSCTAVWLTRHAHALLLTGGNLADLNS